LKRQIFSRFGVPRLLISDSGSHFCNAQLAKVLKHYEVRHKIASSYHPQTNGQAKMSNREIKRILEKTVASSKKDWLVKLDDVVTCGAVTVPISIWQILSSVSGDGA